MQWSWTAEPWTRAHPVEAMLFQTLIRVSRLADPQWDATLEIPNLVICQGHETKFVYSKQMKRRDESSTSVIQALDSWKSFCCQYPCINLMATEAAFTLSWKHSLFDINLGNLRKISMERCHLCPKNIFSYGESEIGGRGKSYKLKAKFWHCNHKFTSSFPFHSDPLLRILSF